MNTGIYRWIMTKPGEPFVKSSFDPAPIAAGEVLVKVAGCGVCHTDLGYFYDGVRTNHALPLALGHEISGRVVEAAPGLEDWIGRAVVVPAVLPCGECDLCRRGHGTICRAQKMPGNDIHGGFASHIAVPAQGLCRVDEARLLRAGLKLADLAVVADAVTTPFQAVTRAGATRDSFAVVIGVGGVGGYAAQICAARGATVAALDVDQAKLDAFADTGITLRLNTRELDARAIKKSLQNFAAECGRSPYEWLIFECSGTAAGQSTAFALLTYGATLCVVGFTMERVDVRLSNLMAFDARAIGNWGCLPELYGPALDMVLDRQIVVAPFVEHFPLDRINEVFLAVHAHKLARRAVLVPTL